MVPVLMGWSGRAHSVTGKNILAARQRSMFNICLLVFPVVVGFSAGTRTVDGGSLRFMLAERKKSGASWCVGVLDEGSRWSRDTFFRA